MQSVDRTLTLFEMLIDMDGDVGMRELSERSGIPVATVHRLLGVLVKRGYARRSGVKRRYGVGSAAYALASRIRTPVGLRQQAQPYLRELVLLSSESANLGLLEGGMVVYVAQVEGPQMLRLFTEVGNRVPFHACASGKALVAFQAADVREALIMQSQLTRHTPTTINSRERLRNELDKVAAQGYALDEGEYEEGVRCVAVPVLDGREQAVAALSVSGPGGRVTRQRLDAWIPRMKTAAAGLAQAVVGGKP